MAGRRRRWGLRFLVALALLVVIGLLVGPRLLGFLGRYLITEDPLDKADAIVVLSEPMEAAELYRAGWAPRVILSDSQKPAGYYELAARGLRLPSGLEGRERVVEFLGVDRGAVDRIEQDFGSTLELACGVVRHARSRRYRTLIVVTDQFHTTEAAKVLALLSDGDPRTIVRPSRYTIVRDGRWWRSRAAARDLLFKYEDLLDYWRIAAQARLAGWILAVAGKPRTAFEALCGP